MVKMAVIAAAGQGTRMYPFSLAVPKELAPIGTVPVIQYVLEQIFVAGISEIIIVLSEGKESIRTFLESAASTSPQYYKSDALRDRMVLFADGLQRSRITYVMQDLTNGIYGTGVPLMLVKELVGDEPFIYTWADDFYLSQPAWTQQVIDIYEESTNSVLAAIPAQNPEDYEKYAYVESYPVRENLVELVRIAEKPGKAEAPSNIGVLSGRLFTPGLMENVERSFAKHTGGEFTMNDVVHEAIASGQKVLVRMLEQVEYFDCGNAESYVETVTRLAKR